MRAGSGWIADDHTVVAEDGNRYEFSPYVQDALSRADDLEQVGPGREHGTARVGGRRIWW
jgi:hypothetical protein